MCQARRQPWRYMQIEADVVLPLKCPGLVDAGLQEGLGNPSNSSWLPRGSALLTHGPQLHGKTVESPLEGPRSLASQHILKPQAPLPPVSPYAHSPLFISALEHPRGFCTSMPLHLWFTRGKIPLPPLFLLVEILPIRQG